MQGQKQRALVEKDFPSEKLQRTFQIRATDTDDQDRLSLSALFSYLQETAYYHAEKLGIGATYLDGQGLCWILRQVVVHLDGLPRWDASVQVTTWQRGAEKLVFWRDFYLSDENGQRLAQVTSQWLLAHKENHRPQRPDRVLPAQKIPPLQAPIFSLYNPRLRDLPSHLPQVLQRPAWYSDIDRNHHVNNTRYVSWAMDAWVDWQNQQKTRYPAALRPSYFSIQYVSEVKLGQRVEFKVSPVDDPASSFRIDAICTATGKTVFRSLLS